MLQCGMKITYYREVVVMNEKEHQLLESLAKKLHKPKSKIFRLALLGELSRK